MDKTQNPTSSDNGSPALAGNQFAALAQNLNAIPSSTSAPESGPTLTPDSAPTSSPELKSTPSSDSNPQAVHSSSFTPHSKSSGRITIIIICAFLMIILLIVGIVILVQKPWESASTSDSTPDNHPAEQLDTDTNKTQLTLDDLMKKNLWEVVMELSRGDFINHLAPDGSIASSAIDATYRDATVEVGQISDAKILRLLATTSKKSECAKKYININGKTADYCLDGETLRERAETLFGRSLQSADGSTTTFDYFTIKYHRTSDEYDVTNLDTNFRYNPFWHELMQATTDGNTIEIDERVATYSQAPDSFYACKLSVATCNHETAIASIELEDPDEIDASQIVREHLDEFDHYQWTFKKIGANNYQFVGLKKIE